MTSLNQNGLARRQDNRLPFVFLHRANIGHTPHISYCISSTLFSIYVSPFNSPRKSSNKKQLQCIFLPNSILSPFDQLLLKMAAERSMKFWSWQKCTKQLREQRGRLYIIWRCTVMLLCWHG